MYLSVEYIPEQYGIAERRIIVEMERCQNCHEVLGSDSRYCDLFKE